MGVCWAKGYLSTMIGVLGISFGTLSIFPLDVNWNIPVWGLGGSSMSSFLESGVALLKLWPTF